MIDLKEINEARALSLPELMRLALEKKLANRGHQVSLCSIINAKSGKCSEDCSFCVQSAHFRTDAPVYPLKDSEEIVAAAVEARKIGASRFSLVTSGRGMKGEEVRRVAGMIREIREKVGIKVCASLGIIGREDMGLLKDAGMSRYHHNLETSREFFPKIVSTHTFDERVETILAAQEVGVEVCAGGIFGLGESEDDRISMAVTLSELRVDSVPINVLVPLPGTPLENMNPLTPEQVLRSIALYRIIHPDVPIRLAAGRESVLQDFLGMAFMAGVDGMMIGGYLTQRGRQPEDDEKFVAAIKKIWTS
ncbi:MAG: biotin synthase BioB [Proteobacteria bacterium]|nr:biotin synthase BioB [Pseudomonadota bacterium]MBU1737543.1 biotin synthase BioB [Pseudomonadota bacterium]